MSESNAGEYKIFNFFSWKSIMGDATHFIYTIYIHIHRYMSFKTLINWNYRNWSSKVVRCWYKQSNTNPVDLTSTTWIKTDEISYHDHLRDFENYYDSFE